MFRKPTKWQAILTLAIIAKVLVMVLVTPWGDLINWSAGASNVLGYLSVGRYPPISATGVYGPLEVILAPFFWLWTKLPIDHPILASLPLTESTPAFSLSIVMKLPSFLADIATGGLVYKLVRQMTNSKRKSQIALLSWYCNPFNIYWIEAFGAMDAIPTAILLLAIVLAMNRRWFSCGLCVAIASILRIFPLFVFPFLFVQAKAKSWREYVLLLLGFLLPLVCAITAMYMSRAGTLSMIASLPQGEYWLLDFLGVNVNQYVKLTLVLLVVQFFITIYYWRGSTLVHGATVALLTLFVGALPYGGYGYHFLWVSPLLSASVSLSFDELWIFIFTFVTASLYPPMIFIPLPSLSALEPLFAGAFFAAKATYLAKINVENISPILKGRSPESVRYSSAHGLKE
ncbi:MAG: hypothetical protein ACLPY5_03625 [Candidatus Bathyarchaeia archaeon]